MPSTKRLLQRNSLKVKTKSSLWQTVEKEYRLSDSKFVAVQRYGRVCYRSKQKDVAVSDIFSFSFLYCLALLIFFFFLLRYVPLSTV